ncbi:MAG: hypothetical protein H7A32_03730 [Deltaproteobacteria bacterium]|nr:hypothetical protein [Deltaproteobacteria bacterium]
MRKTLEQFIIENKPELPAAPVNEKELLLKKASLILEEKSQTLEKQKSFVWPWKLIGTGFSFAALFAFLMIMQVSQRPIIQKAEEDKIGDFLLSTLEDYSTSFNEDNENYF